MAMTAQGKMKQVKGNWVWRSRGWNFKEECTGGLIEKVEYI